MDWLAPAAIWCFTAAAALFPCAYVPYYLRTKVQQRRNQILQLFTNREEEQAKKLAEKYEEVFPILTDRSVSAGDGIVARMDRLHSGRRYAFAGACAWIPAAIGLVVVAAWCVERLAGRMDGPAAIPVPLVMAFVGGCVWSMYELISSGARGDLTPPRVFGLAFRILASVPIGYAFSLLVLEQVAAFAAFAASAFPLRDMRLFVRSQLLKRIEGAPPQAANSRRADSLQHLVQGLGLDTLARLEEIEISTTLDLAYADPITIMVETGFPFEHVVDWKDQALLALYVGGKIGDLSVRGVRGALEATHVYAEQVAEDYRSDPKAVKSANELDATALVKELADTLEISTSAFAHMLGELEFDPHVVLLSVFWGED